MRTRTVIRRERHYNTTNTILESIAIALDLIASIQNFRSTNIKLREVLKKTEAHYIMLVNTYEDRKDYDNLVKAQLELAIFREKYMKKRFSFTKKSKKKETSL